MAKKSSKSKAKRSTSNIFGMFTQNQLSEFKQAFQFIDFDKDGFINKKDIIAAFDSLGKRYPDEDINSMIAEGGGPINYTTFIRLIGEKIYGDEEDDDDLKTALSKFDLHNTGKINRETLFRSLTTFGEKFNKEETNAIMDLIYVDENDDIDVDYLLKTISGSLDD